MVRRYRSSCMEIKQGVPLDPLLLLLYLNDLPLNIHGENLVMFSDDINMLIMDSDICALQRKIYRLIAGLEIWFNRNDLIINVSKTGVTLFHNRQLKLLVKPQVSFNKFNLEYITETKFLCIYIMNTLN